jgi:hypothetical protein
MPSRGVSSFVCLAAALFLVPFPAVSVGTADRKPRYDPATVVDLDATVIDIREAAKDGPSPGISLVVRRQSDAALTVYLGPTPFIRSFEITFRKGDRIHITGSRLKLNGETLILAREVRKESTTLYLRGKNGEPYW